MKCAFRSLAAALFACVALTLLPASGMAQTKARLESASGGYAFISADQLDICASSELEDRYGFYPASNAIDGDNRTAWAEAASGNGAGEWIQLSFPTQQILGFSIRAGYQKSKDIYEKNARPRDILVHVDGERDIRMKLDDVRSRQLVLFDQPVSTETLTIELSSFYKGRKYKDTCITDIGVIQAEEADAAFEDGSWQDRFRAYIRRCFRGDPDARIDWMRLIDLDLDGTPELIVCPHESHVSDCLVIPSTHIDTPAEIRLSFDTHVPDIFRLYRDGDSGKQFWLLTDLYVMQGTQSENFSMLDYAPGRITLTERFRTYDAFEDQAPDYGTREFFIRGKEVSESKYRKQYDLFFDGLEPLAFRYAASEGIMESVQEALAQFEAMCEAYERSA